MNAPNPALADAVMTASLETLCYLHARWRDEHEYEDFGEYSAAMARVVNAVPEVTFVRMTKRPWGFVWDGADGFVRHTRFCGRKVETVRIGAVATGAQR